MWKDWMGSTFLEMFEGQVQVITYSQCLSPLQNDYLYHEPTNKRVQKLMHGIVHAVEKSSSHETILIEGFALP
jgi:hypothetical protein